MDTDTQSEPDVMGKPRIKFKLAEEPEPTAEVNESAAAAMGTAPVADYKRSFGGASAPVAVNWSRASGLFGFICFAPHHDKNTRLLWHHHAEHPSSSRDRRLIYIPQHV